jgi:predicted alpha/beta hydrolase
MSTSEHITRADFTIRADDGYALAATKFAKSESASLASSSPITIIAAATGVPRGFYSRFAGYLAEHGRVAVTFDYRGIGGSLEGHAKTSKARFRDWGIRDIPGVLAWASTSYPDRPIHWVGQSYGGFGTGLAHNNHLIARQYAMSSMSADVRFIENTLERWRASALLFAAGPLVARTLGYAPSWVNGGCDLPAGVLLEWSKWCGTKDFLFGIDDLPEKKYFAQLTAPTCFAYMDDDAWIGQVGVEHLAQRCPNMIERSVVRLTRETCGNASVGHIGFFRSQFRETLWPHALTWLDSKAAT